MAYIISTLIKKALTTPDFNNINFNNLDEIWKRLILEPKDYSYSALYNPITRRLMEKITFSHGGPEYDAKYPDGIPTSL